MSDLFDDVRNEKGLEKPSWYKSDLERVVNPVYNYITHLHKNLDNFDVVYGDFSSRYNKVKEGRVVVLEGESPSQALKDIRESFAQTLNERDEILDTSINNMKDFRKDVSEFFNDKSLKLRLPTTNHLTEELHLPKILLRDNECLDSITYEINSFLYKDEYTNRLENVVFTFKSRDDDSKSLELLINDNTNMYLERESLSRKLLELSDDKLSLSILKTLIKPDFFESVENLIYEDAKRKSDKFYSMKENFKEAKNLLNYLDNNIGAATFFDLPQPLTGVYIPNKFSIPHELSVDSSKVLNASLVHLEDENKFGISIQRVPMLSSRDNKEILITANSKWSDFFTPDIINKNFPDTDDFYEIQKSTKIFLMHLLKNDDLVDNLHHLIENKHIPGKVSMAKNPDVIKDYFSLQSELNKTKEQLLSDEDRKRYEEDSKNLLNIKEKLRTANEVMKKWDKKIDDNRRNLESALLEIKTEYAKLGINIDVVMKEYIK
jgi:predicted DNA-binding WGR domain protein